MPYYNQNRAIFLRFHTEIGFIIVKYLPPKTWSSPHTARKSKSEWMRQAGLQPQEGKVKCVQNIASKLKG